jgi:hypothetical protein
MQCEFPPRRCATSLVTCSTLQFPDTINCLNSAKLCIVTVPTVFPPNCYLKEQQLIPYFKLEENVDINAIKPLDAVWHSVKQYIRGSNLGSSINFRSSVDILWTAWR